MVGKVRLAQATSIKMGITFSFLATKTNRPFPWCTTNLPSSTNVEEVKKVANDSKVVHVGESISLLFAYSFDVVIVVLLQGRLRCQCLKTSRE